MLLCFIPCFIVAQNHLWKIYGLSRVILLPPVISMSGLEKISLIYCFKSFWSRLERHTTWTSKRKVSNSAVKHVTVIVVLFGPSPVIVIVVASVVVLSSCCCGSPHRCHLCWRRHWHCRCWHRCQLRQRRQWSEWDVTMTKIWTGVWGCGGEKKGQFMQSWHWGQGGLWSMNTATGAVIPQMMPHTLRRPHVVNI